MRIWKIRSSVSIEKAFIPTRKASLRAAEKAKEKLPGMWTVQELFGFYIENYEERHKRQWGFTANGSQEMVKCLRTLVTRVGMEEAHRAIKSVFSLKWVLSQHERLLVNQDLYERHVAPILMRTEAKVGEQAEWSGTRNFESREVPASEFFGDN